MKGSKRKPRVCLAQRLGRMGWGRLSVPWQLWLGYLLGKGRCTGRTLPNLQVGTALFSRLVSVSALQLELRRSQP